MREFFPGYFPKDEVGHKSLWGQCIFVFDTNILLNMYRYSDDTRASFLQVLDKLKERVWIPHRVADEYLTNRLKVIFEQQEEYSSAIGESRSLRKKLENSRQHPFVSKQIMEKAEEAFDALELELEKNQSIHSKRMNDDEIKSHLADIFKDRVGRRLEAAELEEIISEGERRYAEKIPPGYSDSKKASSEDFLSARCRQYGDLIVWKQIIEKSITEKKPIIFITDDGKEDWWLRFKGKTIGPRPELIEEFMAGTGLEFHMYHPERFLSLASDYLKQESSISMEMLDEVRNLRVKEYAEHKVDPQVLLAVKKQEYYDENLRVHEDLAKELSRVSKRLDAIRGDISYFDKMRLDTRREMMGIRDHFHGIDLESSEDYLSCKAQHEEYAMVVRGLTEEYEYLTNRTEELRHKLMKAEKVAFDIHRSYLDFNGDAGSDR